MPVRLILLLVLLAGVAEPQRLMRVIRRAGGSAPTPSGVQYDGNNQAFSTFTSTPTVGNTVMVCFSYFGVNNTVTGASDNQGNTYTNIYLDGNGTDTVDGCYYSVISATGSPFTVTIGASNTEFATLIAEYHNLASSSILDQLSASASDGGVTMIVSDPVTTTQANEMLVAFCTCTNSATAGSGFTKQESQNRQVPSNLFDKAVSSTGTYTFTGTMTTNDYRVRLFSLKGAP